MTPADQLVNLQETDKTESRRSLTLRVVVASVILLGTQLGVNVISRGFTPPPPVMPQWKLDDFPLQFGSWKGTVAPIDERVFIKSNARMMVNRHYTNPLVGHVTVHLALWDQYHIILPHSPTDSYTRAG